MRLAELQQAFWDVVRTRGAPPPGLDLLFTGSDRQSASERIAVYHVAYWHRQLAALSATFPRTLALLKERFERLAFGYVERRPCGEPRIELLGADFPDFLQEQGDISLTTLGVARLEWATSAALLARHAPTLKSLPRDLGSSFVDCRLQLVPSLHVVHVPQASLAWLDESAGSADAMDQSVMIDVAFHRPEFAVRHVALAADEARAHLLARGGGNIALICSAFAALPETEAATRALTVLGSWFARGWVSRCEP
jgi:hypothetical protein